MRRRCGRKSARHTTERSTIQCRTAEIWPLESGKYYLQDYVIYRCTRDTINPVYNALADLVGIYVEVEHE